MARIYLDARNITKNPSGVARYAISLIPELVQMAPEHQFIVIRHSSNRESIFESAPNLQETFLDLKIDELPNHLGGNLALGHLFGKYGNPDLFHSLFHIIPKSLPGFSIPSPVVTTLHDFVWIDHPHESQPSWVKAKLVGAFANWAIPETLRLSDHVIAVSEPTARRATRWIPEDKLTTIYHGVDASFFEEPDADSSGLSRLDFETHKVISAIGNDKPYKNLKRLITAFSFLRKHFPEARLVLIGNCSDLSPVINSLGLEDQVIRPGFIEEKQLQQILAHSALFVFPSLIEGFGLPILEAMAAGAPVITSDKEPMRTVAGDAGRLVDPLNTEALADAMMEILSRDEVSAELSNKSRRHAQQFRWEKTARRTLEVYDRFLSY